MLELNFSAFIMPKTWDSHFPPKCNCFQPPPKLKTSKAVSCLESRTIHNGSRSCTQAAAPPTPPKPLSLPRHRHRSHPRNSNPSLGLHSPNLVAQPSQTQLFEPTPPHRKNKLCLFTTSHTNSFQTITHIHLWPFHRPFRQRDLSRIPSSIGVSLEYYRGQIRISSRGRNELDIQ